MVYFVFLPANTSDVNETDGYDHSTKSLINLDNRAYLTGASADEKNKKIFENASSGDTLWFNSTFYIDNNSELLAEKHVVIIIKGKSASLTFKTGTSLILGGKSKLILEDGGQLLTDFNIEEEKEQAIIVFGDEKIISSDESLKYSFADVNSADGYDNTTGQLINLENKDYITGASSDSENKEYFSSLSSGDTIWVNSKFLIDNQAEELAKKNVVIVVTGKEASLTFKSGSYLVLGEKSKIILLEGGQLIADFNIEKEDQQAFIAFGDEKIISSDDSLKYSFEKINDAGGYDGGIGSPLPVDLVSFSAFKQKDGVILSWITASEINNSHFEIERSEDGKTFNMIDQVAGNGNSNTTKSYSFKDEFLPQNFDMMFYRLKQVDFDGKFEYTKTVSVHLNDLVQKELKVYPSPANVAVNVYYPHPNFNMQIVNAKGETVYKTTSINTVTSVDCTSFPTGVYFVHIETDRSSEVKRIVVKH
jgi:hypothetical protein